MFSKKNSVARSQDVAGGDGKWITALCARLARVCQRQIGDDFGLIVASAVDVEQVIAIFVRARHQIGRVRDEIVHDDERVRQPDRRRKSRRRA